MGRAITPRQHHRPDSDHPDSATAPKLAKSSHLTLAIQGNMCYNYFLKKETHRERMVDMNIQGATMTAPVIPQNMGAVQAPVQAPEAEMSAESLNLSAAVSTQVLDMAQTQFEDSANQLLDQMAAMTGVGQNVNMMA